MTVLPTDGRMTSLAPYTAALPSSALVEVVTPGNAATGVNYKMQIGDLANSLSTAAQAPGGTVLGNASSTTAAMAPTAIPVLGIPAVVTGSLGLANGGAAGATITIVNFGATAAYNLALPTTAGTAGQVMLSQGGGTTPNLWQNLGSIAVATTGLFITGSTSIAVGIATGGVNSPQLAIGAVLGTSIATNAVGNIQLRQGSPLSVVGIAGNATTNLADIIAIGANQFLQSNAGGTGLLFTTLVIGTSALPGPYQTGTLTANAVLLGNGTSPIKSTVTTAIGLPLLSNGTSLAPAFDVLTLTGGGLGTTTLTAHGILIGAGTATLKASTTQTAGQILVGQNITTDPSWQTISGDFGLTAGGVATVSNNAITFAKFQQVAGLSVIGVAGNATTNVAAVTGSNGQFLKVTNATTLAFTSLAAVTITSFLTSSGTFTTPTGSLYLVVQMVGASGGSGGSGTGASPGGAASSDTTFASGALVLTAGRGAPGTVNVTNAAGGTATGGDINIVGGFSGIGPGSATAGGAQGGISFFGGAAPANPPGTVNGAAPSPNSGSGASGASSGTTASAGGGSAAGGYVYKVIGSPAVSYTWVVGIAGTAGTAGTQGNTGAAGSNGLITVWSYFQ